MFLEDPKNRQKLATLGVFYILLMVLVVVGDLTKEWTRPLTSLIFPINDRPLAYNMVVMTAFYWGMMGFLWFINTPGKSPDDSDDE